MRIATSLALLAIVSACSYHKVSDDKVIQGPWHEGMVVTKDSSTVRGLVRWDPEAETYYVKRGDVVLSIQKKDVKYVRFMVDE
jgi:hypothetical protein